MDPFFARGIGASPQEDWANSSTKLISLLSQLPLGLAICDCEAASDHTKCGNMELPKLWFEAATEPPRQQLPKISSIGASMKRQRPKERAFKCSKPECNKSFLDSSSLYKHSQTHGERQFLCTFPNCGKQFFEKAKLRRHVLVHTVRITQGERSYECSKCGKTFALDFNLKTHMRTHTGERPYECSVSGCRKKFTQSSNLTSHMKVHKLKNLIETSSSTLQFRVQDVFHSPKVV